MRGTKKLLERMHPAVVQPDDATTTALGDWYANLVRVGPTQFVLCTSDRSLLSVVLPAREVRTHLVSQLQVVLRRLLEALRVPDEFVTAELQEMERWGVGHTASRQVLGHMRDFALNLDAAVRMNPDQGLLQLSLDLSGIPCGPVIYVYPRERAAELLSGAWSRRTRG